MRAVRVVDSKIATCYAGSSLEPVVELAPGESVELEVDLHMRDCAGGPGSELLGAGRCDVAVMVDIDPPSLSDAVEISGNRDPKTVPNHAGGRTLPPCRDRRRGVRPAAR